MGAHARMPDKVLRHALITKRSPTPDVQHLHLSPGVHVHLAAVFTALALLLLLFGGCAEFLLGTAQEGVVFPESAPHVRSRGRCVLLLLLFLSAGARVGDKRGG